MNAMALVEVAIGMTFVYLLLSIACSAGEEWLAQRANSRGRLLREGIIKLIEDRWFYLRLINHPALAASFRDVPGRPRPPSYASPASFVTAVMDLLVTKAIKLDPKIGINPLTPRTPADLVMAAQVCANNGFAIGHAVLPLVTNVATIEEARASIEGWYQATMDRVSGWYKASARKRLFYLGLVAALAFNVDSVRIGYALIQSSTLRTTVADLATAQRDSMKALLEKEDGKPDDTLRYIRSVSSDVAKVGLPVGYSCLGEVQSDRQLTALQNVNQVLGNCADKIADVSITEIIIKIFGFLITGFAVSFGAQFWFDLVNKFINIRASGAKPK